MAHDEEFEGVTYISHGAAPLDSDDTVRATPDQATKKDSTTPEPKDAIVERIDKLEKEFAAYKLATARKLKAIENLAKKETLSLEERILQIQEDS